MENVETLLETGGPDYRIFGKFYGEKLSQDEGLYVKMVEKFGHCWFGTNQSNNNTNINIKLLNLHTDRSARKFHV